MTASKIEWTDRSDWNPIRGCARESEGCRNCYAERIAARFSGPGQPFHGIAERTKSGPRWTGKMVLVEERLDLPLRWRKPARIFVNSMFDLFHPDIPDEWIDRVFAVMALAPAHTFLVLTKRAARMREYMAALEREALWMNAVAASIERYKHFGLCHECLEYRNPWVPLPNVMLGVSAEDQVRADERIPELLATPAAKRFLSAEPLLSHVDLSEWLAVELIKLRGRDHWTERTGMVPALDWVIAGGESGAGARPMHPAWPNLLRAQCSAAEVPFLFKQWGNWTAYDGTQPPTPLDLQCWLAEDGRHFGGSEREADRVSKIERDAGEPLFKLMVNIGKKRAGKLLDGREYLEFPTQVPL